MSIPKVVIKSIAKSPVVKKFVIGGVSKLVLKQIRDNREKTPKPSKVPPKYGVTPREHKIKEAIKENLRSTLNINERINELKAKKTNTEYSRSTQNQLFGNIFDPKIEKKSKKLNSTTNPYFGKPFNGNDPSENMVKNSIIRQAGKLKILDLLVKKAREYQYITYTPEIREKERSL